MYSSTYQRILTFIKFELKNLSWLTRRTETYMKAMLLFVVHLFIGFFHTIQTFRIHMRTNETICIYDPSVVHLGICYEYSSQGGATGACAPPF